MSGLYLSTWSPRGARKDWDRTSLSGDDATLILDQYHIRRPSNAVVDCVAWTDARAALRCLVADMADRRRIILRVSRNNWSVEILPEAVTA